MVSEHLCQLHILTSILMSIPTGARSGNPWGGGGHLQVSYPDPGPLDPPFGRRGLMEASRPEPIAVLEEPVGL